MFLSLFFFFRVSHNKLASQPTCVKATNSIQLRGTKQKINFCSSYFLPPSLSVYPSLVFVSFSLSLSLAFVCSFSLPSCLRFYYLCHTYLCCFSSPLPLYVLSLTFLCFLTVSLSLLNLLVSFAFVTISLGKYVVVSSSLFLRLFKTLCLFASKCRNFPRFTLTYS